LVDHDARVRRAGGGKLERSTRPILPADVSEIELAVPGSGTVRRVLDRRRLRLAAEVGDDLRKVPRRHRIDPGQRGLGGLHGERAALDAVLEPGFDPAAVAVLASEPGLTQSAPGPAPPGGPGPAPLHSRSQRTG
jgi:hypothetical protein